MLIVSYKISLKCLIYYFYHLTTLKNYINMMFMNYLILLLNMGYTILAWNKIVKSIILYLYEWVECHNFNSEHNTKCRLHNVISLFSPKKIMFCKKLDLIYICCFFQGKKGLIWWFFLIVFNFNLCKRFSSPYFFETIGRF